MEFNEQEKGILIGIVLTVIVFYISSFFLSSQTPSESDLKQAKIEQTRADKFLNEPLGLYTGVGEIDDGPRKNRRNTLKKMKGTISRKKVVADKKATDSKENTNKTENEGDEKKEDEDKKGEDEETEEDSGNTDIEVDNSYAEKDINIKGEESSRIAGVSGSLYPGHMSAENENTEELDTIEEWITYFASAQSLSSI